MKALSFTDLIGRQIAAFRFGKDIKLDIKSRPLIDFRITYGNPNSHTDPIEGVSIITGSLKSFVDEMYGQLSDNGYVIEPCNEMFCKDCAYIYLKEKDKQKEYPRLKVYVHPNELAGWAPKTHVKKLLEIAEENSFTRNVGLVYSQKVYILSDEEYLDILKKAEPQIKDWLIEYKKHRGRKRMDPGRVFDELFGIKRLSLRHLGYRDYVASRYVDRLFYNLK